MNSSKQLIVIGALAASVAFKSYVLVKKNQQIEKLETLTNHLAKKLDDADVPMTIADEAFIKSI